MKYDLRTHVQTIHFRIVYPLIICMIISLILVSSSLAGPVRNEKDKITLSLELIEANGKHRIVSILSNQSEHTIAAANYQTNSGEFYFKLLNQAGHEILPDPKWAEEFAQKSSYRYNHPRSFRADQIDAGRKFKFEFDLEDAYGSKMASGTQLEVSWEGIWLDPTVETSEYRDQQGTMIPSRVEKYEFSQHWNLSVSLPLTASPTKEIAPSPSAASSIVEIPPPNKIQEATPTQKEMSTKAENTLVGLQSSINPWWWLLLTIPFLFLIWRSVRLRRPS